MPPDRITQDKSTFVSREPCPECGSSDAGSRYTDGHLFCFSCGHYEPGDDFSVNPSERRETRRLSSDLIDLGEPQAISARRLTVETCAKWGYTVSDLGGQAVQVANYRDPETGRVVAQKVRFKNKDFKFLGDTKAAGLYGQSLWRDGGKMVVVTEGEIDALSVSQVQGNRWPVVSVPNGAQGAKKALSAALQWLLRFETVVLMFDGDEPGEKAAGECALIFPPGRCKIAKLPLKDASEMLKAGREREIIDAIWGAREFRPDGVVTISDVRDRVLETPTHGLPWWTEKLSALTYGRRTGEIYAFGAGTGVGKTDFLTEQIQFDISHLKEPVAVFALEQQPVETVKRIAGKLAGRRFHVPDGSWTGPELVDALDSLERSGKLYLYDSFGATDWEVIQATIRFLAHSCGVRLFYIDHLTALAAAENDERTALERIMSEMGALVKELDVVIHLVSHLATPEGKPHEEGGRVMIRHFKGSRAIGFWCHFMFGLERNQQAEDPQARSTTTFRVLKDRYTGQATGQCVWFGYDPDRGRLVELAEEPGKDRSEHGFASYGDAAGADTGAF